MKTTTNSLLLLAAGAALSLTYAFSTPNTNTAMLDTMTKSEAKTFATPDEVAPSRKGAWN